MTTAIMLLINNRWHTALTVFLEESEQSISAEVFCVEFVNMMCAGKQERDAKKSQDVPVRCCAIFFSVNRVSGQSPV